MIQKWWAGVSVFQLEVVERRQSKIQELKELKNQQKWAEIHQLRWVASHSSKTVQIELELSPTYKFIFVAMSNM